MMIIVALFGFLAVFSLISILLSAEDTERIADPRDNPLLWVMLGRH